MTDQPYVYLFVREDLSPAQKVVQVAHAVEELTKRTTQSARSISITNFMVLFSVADLDKLIDAVSFLEQKGIVFEVFYEPDINEHTAIATEPLSGERRRVMEKFTLME